MGNVSSCWFFFPYTCSETLGFSSRLPIVIFTRYVNSCTQWVSSSTHVQDLKQSLFHKTANWFSFPQVFSWVVLTHLSQKWSFLIRARTWWASNLIFADNSFSTSGVFWMADLVFCWFGFVYFFLFFPLLSFLEFLLWGKVCLDRLISCGEVGFWVLQHSNIYVL